MIELTIYVLIAGVGLCIVPFLSGLRNRINQLLLHFDILLFFIIGTIFMILTLINIDQYSILSALAFFFGILSLCFKVVLSDPMKNKTFKRFHSDKKIRIVGVPLIGGVIILLIAPLIAMFIIHIGSLYGAFLFYEAEIPIYAGDVYADLYFAIINSPLIITMGVLASIGAMVKVITIKKSGQFVANMLILVLPFMIWFLTVLGIVPIPELVYKIYNNDLLAYISYIILFLVIIIFMAGISFVFQGVQDLQY